VKILEGRERIWKKEEVVDLLREIEEKGGWVNSEEEVDKEKEGKPPEIASMLTGRMSYLDVRLEAGIMLSS
jgi:hypothetical protein